MLNEQSRLKADGLEPTLLIIVPTLDSYRLLPRLLDSLRRQTFTGWSVLFIDGPSGPEHRAVLDQLCHQDARFRWQPQDPAEPGIFAAMNQGFAAAAPHDWLLFWGSDDWAPALDVLERAMAAIEDLTAQAAPPDLLVCRGRYVKGSRPGRATAFRWRGTYRRSLFLGSTPPHQATLIGPGARSRLSRYAPGFRLSADLDYFLQLCLDPQLRVQTLDLELVHMAQGGVSGVQHRRRLHEVRCAYRRAFGWCWPFPYLLRYAQRFLSALA